MGRLNKRDRGGGGGQYTSICAAVAVRYHTSNIQTYYQTPHLGGNAKEESKCYVRNPWVQGNTAIHGTPEDGRLLSPHGSRNYAWVMSIPDLPLLRVRNVFNLKLCTSLGIA